MAFSTRANFVGVLDGTNVNEINKKIDYSKTKLEERKEVVEGILEGTHFYEEYFTNHFKGAITAGESLSQDVNVCKSLERMANYLLNSEEIKAEEDADQIKYVFHTDEKYFRRKVGREISTDQLTESGQGTEDVLHFLQRPSKNHKKPKDQIITPEDLERKDFVGEVLRSYSSYRDYITKELKNPNTKHNRFMLTKIKGQLNIDLIYCKDHLTGVWGYDLQNFTESTCPDIDVFDFTNKEHLLGRSIIVEDKKGKTKEHRIKGLLYFKPTFQLDNDFSLILQDLQNTINKANLTEKEKYVLEQIRNGSTLGEIALELQTSHVNINRTMSIIASKVIKVGNKYDAIKEEA